MKIIDTHTHLNDKAFDFDRLDVINRAKSVGIIKIINAADTIDSFAKIIKLSEDYPNFCYGAYGIHPNEIHNLEEIHELEKVIQKKVLNVVAVGEIGLDFHYSPSEKDKELQISAFKKQMDIAKKYSLPIVIHSRDADLATFDLVTNANLNVPVVLHCYSGSFELAERYIKEGLNIHFGIGGVITFKNARKLVEVVNKIPLDFLLVETDAPYLSPTPHRGERNESGLLPIVIDKIAELKHLSSEFVASNIRENTREVFKI